MTPLDAIGYAIASILFCVAFGILAFVLAEVVTFIKEGKFPQGGDF